MKKRIIIICIAVALVLGVMILFSYCGDRKIDAAIETQVDIFIDAVLRDDKDSAYKVLSDSVEYDDFLQFYYAVQGLFDDAKDYELKQIGWRVYTDLGARIYIAMYELRIDTGRGFLLEAVMQKNSSDITIYINDLISRDSISNEALLVLNIVLTLLSIASYAFCVCMLSDCAKRKEKYRWLWFILILMSVSLSANTDIYSWGWGFDLGLLSRSMLTMRVTDLVITVSFPVGALIYRIFRDFKPADKNDTAYYDYDKLSLVLKSLSQKNELSNAENADTDNDTPQI